MEQVWLLEGERLEHWVELEKQRQHNDKTQVGCCRIIQEQIQAIRDHDNNDMPLLLGPYVSEGESDDNSSVNINNSLGRNDYNSEGEDDMWDNHPIVNDPNQSFNRKSKVPTNNPTVPPVPNESSPDIPRENPCLSSTPTAPSLDCLHKSVPPESPGNVLGHGSDLRSNRLRKQGQYFYSLGKK